MRGNGPLKDDEDKNDSLDVTVNSSVKRFLWIDPMVNGLNPPSTKLSLRVRRVANSVSFQS